MDAERKRAIGEVFNMSESDVDEAVKKAEGDLLFDEVFKTLLRCNAKGVAGAFAQVLLNLDREKALPFVRQLLTYEKQLQAEERR